MEDIPSFHICHLDLSKLDQNVHVVFDWCTVCDRLCFHGDAHEWWGSSVQRPPLAWVGCHAWRTNSLHLYWFSLERFDLHWDSFFLISWMSFHLWYASSGHLNMHVFHMQVYTRYHSQRIWSTYYLISYIVYCTPHIEFDKNPRCCFYPA